MTEQREPVWRTRDGQKIPLSEMETDHIRNARAMCNRAVALHTRHALGAFAYASDAPDGAAMAAEQEGNMIMDQMEKAMKWVSAFDRELKTRGENDAA